MNGIAGKLQRLRTMHLFAGAGGGILADILLGHQPICAVEINQYCQQVLAARQKDGCLPFFPIFGDVTEFDGHPWRGLVDVVCGGWPCQDLSIVGGIHGKQQGLQGERSGLWSHEARIIREVRPKFAYMENSPMLLDRGFGDVLGDLAAMGFDADWGVLGGSDIDRDHHRKRIWILGYPNGNGWEGQPKATDSEKKAILTSLWGSPPGTNRQAAWDRYSPATEPSVLGTPDELAFRVDRLKAIGNGQIPTVAATAWEILSK